MGLNVNKEPYTINIIKMMASKIITVIILNMEQIDFFNEVTIHRRRKV